MPTAMEMALSAFQTACQVTPELDEQVYPRRMSEFIVRTLGGDPWDKQIEIADAVDDNRYVAVASCHGAGKSHIAARIALAFLHTRARSVVITTAPTARQVQHVLWREINAAYRGAKYPLLGRCLTTRYEIAPEWYAIGFKAKATPGISEDDTFQGFHADNVLVIFDEAAGVPESVFGSLDAAMTSENAHMLMIGNPTSVSGQFREAFHRNRSLFKTIKISAFDTPNFQIEGDEPTRPYLVTKRWVREVIAKRGEGSPYVQSRVYANFPEIGTNKLIPLSWIEAAEARSYARSDEKGVIVGIDAARFGDDETSLSVRRGTTLVKHIHWQGLSLTQSRNEVKKQLRDFKSVEEIRVDAIGLGAGLADMLREEGFTVYDVNASAKSSDPEEWPNFRHEMWWQLRERFNIEHPMISVDPRCGLDEEAMAQLSDIEYSFKDTRFQGAIIEPKEETKKRTGTSPDRAESLALAYCVLPPPELPASRPRAGIAKSGGWSNAQKYRGAKIARRRQ